MNEEMMFSGNRSANLLGADGSHELMGFAGVPDTNAGLRLPNVPAATGGDPLSESGNRLPATPSVDEILLGGEPSAFVGIEPDEIDIAIDSRIDPLIGVPLTPSPQIDDLAVPQREPEPLVIDDFVAIPGTPNDRTFSQDSNGILGVPEASDRFGQVIATGDFNGDGYLDLAAGVPGESVNNLEDAGTVNVIYGSASGLTATGDQIWHQNTLAPQTSAPLQAIARPGDAFGSSLAAGDFNGDGYTDLAVGAPNNDVLTGSGNRDNAGEVNIIYGSATGLTATGNQSWHQDSPGIIGTAETGDNFGRTLTAGDFNGDGYVDLAVGAPGEDVFDIADAGSVNVIYGAAGGLTAFGDQSWHQDSGQAQQSPVIDSVAEARDNFGASLTSGDFNGDGVDDLAIGAPGESVGNIEDAGAATVIYGSNNRLTATGHQTWHQNSAGIAETAETGDRFAFSLAAGDFNGDGTDDLAAGAYSEDIGSATYAGGVNVIYGSNNRLSATGNQFWSQDSAGVQGVADFGDYFGWSLTTGDFDGDGYTDLGVGVPLEEFVSTPTNSGAVNVLRGSDNRLTSQGDRLLTQNHLADNDNPPEVHDRFGISLAAGDFNGDGRSDLAVGVPYEDIDGVTDVGEVDVFYNV